MAEFFEAYEKTMFPWGAKLAAESQKGLDMMFADGPPRKIVLFFRTMSLVSRLTRPFERAFASKSRTK